MTTNRRLLPFTLLLACLAVYSAKAEPAAWSIEPNTDDPHYAAVVPAETSLNIAAIVLACENVDGARILQMQLYLTDDGPLRAKAAPAGPLKDEPRAELSIDGRIFPVSLMFADTYAVLADDRDGYFPKLSDQLVAALRSGDTLTLHFDLLAEPPGRPAAFDGEAVVSLAGSGGRQAIAAMRHCVNRTGSPRIALAQLHH
jgi:hypothetical protein